MTTQDDRSDDAKFEDLINHARRAMQRFRVPGVSIALITNGKDYTAGLGVTSITNPLEVTPQTLFQIGSTSKTFTATLIMRLVELGRLSLDDRVRKFLPDFKVSDDQASAEVTVRHLLTHTCGWLGDFFPETGNGDDAIAKYVAFMNDLPQMTPLGMYYSYNNAALIVAGRVVEVITGKPFEASMREMILEPLEMNNSFFFPGEVMLRRFAVGHILEEQSVVVADPWPVPRFAAPAGGVNSDACDQLKYMHFHMGDGSTSKGERLLTPESLRLMQTPMAPLGDGNWVGLTWTIEDIDGVRFYSHGGTTNGQESDFWMAPRANTALTVMTNLDRGNVLHADLSAWVKEHYLGVVKQFPSTTSLTERELAAFTADFVTSSNDLVKVTPFKGGILLTHVLQTQPEENEPGGQALPPMHAKYIEGDRFLVFDQPFKDATCEFLRREDGEIAWMRIGGRILPRKSNL
jgi:CubicO group peptidase (beta-lactamase class C family)